MSKKWVGVVFVAAICFSVCVTVGVLYAAETQKVPHAKPPHKKPDLPWNSFKPVESEYRVIGFGSQTLLTCAVMANHCDDPVHGTWSNLDINTLFGDNTSAVYVFGVWLKNLNDIEQRNDGTFDVGDVQAAIDAVKALIKSPPFPENTKYKELYNSTLWSNPVPAIQALEAAGVQLPFVHYKKNTLQSVVDQLKVRFGNFDLPSLMFTPADPQIFTDEDIDAVERALHSADRVLFSDRGEDEKGKPKSGIPDILVEHKVAGYQYRVPWPGNNPLCCNRTTRICGTNPNKVCTTCGTICCLGSQWC